MTSVDPNLTDRVDKIEKFAGEGLKTQDLKIRSLVDKLTILTKQIEVMGRSMKPITPKSTKSGHSDPKPAVQQTQFVR